MLLPDILPIDVGRRSAVFHLALAAMLAVGSACQAEDQAVETNAKEEDAQFAALHRELGTHVIVAFEGTGEFAMRSRTMSQSLESHLVKIEGVQSVTPSLVEFRFTGLAFPLCGYVPETAVFEHYQMLAGRKLKRTDRFAMMVGSKVAEKENLQVDDTVESLTETWKVVGIFKTNNDIEPNLAIVPLAQLQELTQLNRPDDPRVLGFFISTTDPKNREQHVKVQSEVNALLVKLKQQGKIQIRTSAFLPDEFMKHRRKAFEAEEQRFLEELEPIKGDKEFNFKINLPDDLKAPVPER